MRRRLTDGGTFLLQLVDGFLVLALFSCSTWTVWSSSCCNQINSYEVRPHSVSITELLGVGSHLLNQIPSLNKSHITKGSTTGSINHTPHHVAKSLIEILQKELLRNLVVRTACTQSLLQMLPLPLLLILIQILMLFLVQTRQ